MSNSRSNETYGESLFRVIAVRLSPGDDVRLELINICERNRIEAAVVLGAVGSLSTARIRFANQPEPVLFEDKLEILSLSGTVSRHGLHLHVSVADSSGNCKGGHVARGCQVYTTLEIVIGILENLQFTRAYDSKTGCKELWIRDQANPG